MLTTVSPAVSFRPSASRASLIVPHAGTTEEMLKVGETTLLESGAVEQGEMIVIMAGRLSGLGLSSSVTLFTIAGTLGAAGPEVSQAHR